MGQHSSKRRSYTPGQDVQSEIPTNSLVNGDVKYDTTANGGIEDHQKDVQMRGPKATVERQASSSSSGKKDKSKKIRIIGISLRRTPSGRWTRKRRSVRANGSARPVSCPVTDLKPKDKGTQPRPQSLFEEEVINEEDGKIETVDLSDNEDGTQATSGQAGAAGPVPKPRDKKMKRTPSDKRQGSKKKKKEKKSSKKEKSKKPSSPKSTKAPDVPVTSPGPSKSSAEEDPVKPVESPATEETQKQKETSDINEIASSIVNDSINIARERYISEQDTTEENISASNQNSQPEDLSGVGLDVSLTPVVDVIESPRPTPENESTPTSSIEASPPEVEDDTIVPSVAPVKEMTPVLFKGEDEHDDIENDKDDKSSLEEKHEEPIEVQVEVVKNEPEATDEQDKENKTEIINADIPSTFNLSQVPKTTEDLNEVVEDVIVMEKVDKVKTLPILYISPPEDEVDGLKEDADNTCEAETTQEAEQAAQDKNDKEPISETGLTNVSLENEAAENIKTSDDIKVEESQTSKIDSSMEKSNETENEPKNDTDATHTDTETDKKHKTKHTKEQREKEKAEKERLKKQKEEEKAKEKERLKEEKRRKAEQKSAEKVKLREKGDRKSTISQRFSDWFKKDKTTKSPGSSSSQADADVNNSAGPSGASLEANSDMSSTQTGSVPNESADSHQNTSSSLPDPSVGESLTVDASVQPLPNLTCPAESDQNNSTQSSPSDSASPESSPVSPISNDIPCSDPTTPTSDGEKGESSGVLKKILLGPRLRTAILRKKSSSASDSGSEDKRVSLTQPKGVEMMDVTPPPRKLRPRKPVEQYSPVTVGAHNPLRNPSPLPEHNDNDSLPVDSELDISCQDSLPKTQDNTTDEQVSSSVVTNNASNNVVNDNDISSQSTHDHPSINNEPNTEISNITTENLDDSSPISSSESQSESAITDEVSEQVIEKINTQTVSLDMTQPSIDNAISSEENREEIESECNELKSEINQSESAEDESSVRKDCDNAETKDYDDSDNDAEDVQMQSPTLVSTARIVLRSTSVGDNEQVPPTLEVNKSSSESQAEVFDSTPVPVEEQETEIPSPVLVEEEEDCKGSIKEIADVNKDNISENVGENKNDEILDAPEKPEVMVCVLNKLEEVTVTVSEISMKSSGDEKEELDDDGEEEECTPSQYKVVCTAMSADDEQQEVLTPSAPSEEPEPSEDGNKDNVELGEKSADEAASRVEETETQTDNAQDEASDSSTDNNDGAPSTSSSSDHWESPKLDIQLDDSAIEMDKESPLADTQSPVSIDCSSSVTSSIKHEDEGVNSDNSSDSNDTGSDNVEKGDDSNSKPDSSSSDTIEAYLKLQQHEDVKNVSPKNHLVDECGLLETEDFKVRRSENGVDDDDGCYDASRHTEQDHQTPKETTLASN